VTGSNIWDEECLGITPATKCSMVVVVKYYADNDVRDVHRYLI